MGDVGAGRLCRRIAAAAGRGVRRGGRADEQLPPVPTSPLAQPDRRHRQHAVRGQRQGLPCHANLLQVESSRAEPHRAIGLLDLVGRRPFGLPKPFGGGMRHGPGRRRHRPRAAPHGLPPFRAGPALARRALPRLRRQRPGDAFRQRGGPGPAEAPAGRGPRRRPHPRRHPRLGGQQRRRRETELLGRQRRRPGRSRRRRAGRRRGRAGHNRLRRDARHRHVDGRSGRNRRPDPGLPPPRPAEAVLRHRFGEDQHRPPRSGCRRRRADQGGPLAGA